MLIYLRIVDNLLNFFYRNNKGNMVFWKSWFLSFYWITLPFFLAESSLPVFKKIFLTF